VVAHGVLERWEKHRRRIMALVAKMLKTQSFIKGGGLA
jgi:hypothetical protein